MPGAGKSTIAEGLKSKNYEIINLGNAVREEARNRNCNYEGTISNPPLDVEDLYLGNINNVSDQNTAGLYICEGGDNRLSATTVVDTCPTSNLVCDENVSETVGLRRYIHCPDNHYYTNSNN